jgi:hypothetical protein
MATTARRKYSVGIGLTPTVIGAYTAPSVTTGTYVSALTIANTLTGPSIVVTVDIFDGTTAVNWVKNALIMQGGCLTLATDSTRMPLNNGDQVRVTSNLAASCDAIMGVSEIT